jgi:hypothetical protein
MRSLSLTPALALLVSLAGAAAIRAADNGSQIDVLVAYTAQARDAAGGTTAMQNRITNLMAQVNQALTNSGVQFQFRVVRTVEVAYSGSADHRVIIRHLQAQDGVMDGVLAQRNTYKADLVHLILGPTELGNSCGSGFVRRNGDPDPQAWGFSITNYSCATDPNGDKFQIGHALGHNFGLQHSMADPHEDGRNPDDPPPPGLTDYAYGYMDPDYRFRDIMSSDCPVYGPNGNPELGIRCPRLQYYSSASVTHDGAPIGHAATADAARMMNELRVSIANYRDSGVTATPTPTPRVTPRPRATVTPTTPPRPRPTLQNLAVGRPAISSPPCNANTRAVKAVNGTFKAGMTDKWCSNKPAKWMRVDLGSRRVLTRIVVRHAGAGGEKAAFNTRAYAIRTSLDGKNWTLQRQVANNKANANAILLASKPARFVRLEVTQGTQSGGGAARIYELEVWGR